MAQSARNMSGFDAARRNSARFDAIDEVPQMRLDEIAGPGGNRFFVSVDLPSSPVDDQRPSIAAEGDRRTSPFLPVRAPQAMFPGNHLSGIAVNDEQGVGRLLVVVKMMFAARRRDLRRKVDGQSPAGD